MKELGEYLKETRVNNGVSVDEAAQDLNIDSFLIESIEEGNTRAFKDVLSVKNIVKDYAKYLGLKPEEVIDEFNDYMFEKTSKISLQDILDAENEQKNKEKRICSPYTIVIPKKKDKRPFIYGLCIIIVIALLIMFIFMNVKPKRGKVTDELRAIGDDYFEFTY